MNTLLEETAPKAANAAASPILIVNDSRGRRGMALEEDSYTIGRSSRCSIRLADRCVSRIHARLNRVNLGNHKSRFQILDGEFDNQPSTNGVLIDGQPVKNRMLKLGDTLWFSNQTYIVFTTRQELSPEELETLDFGQRFDSAQAFNDLAEETTAAASLGHL